MKMTVEKLLNPRYKVIADFPDAGRSESLLGHIEEWVDGLHVKKDLWKKFYNKYPAIYKELKWYEERKVNDMPEYVKHHKDIHVLRVEEWDPNTETFTIDKYGLNHSHMFTPATEQEYIDYQNTLNPRHMDKQK